MSQDMGDSDDESSNYTDSQVSEREEDNLSDVNTVQQNGSMIVLPNVEAPSEDNSINVVPKQGGPNLSFSMNKFNSVVPMVGTDENNSEREKPMDGPMDSHPDILNNRLSN